MQMQTRFDPGRVAGRPALVQLVLGPFLCRTKARSKMVAVAVRRGERNVGRAREKRRFVTLAIKQKEQKRQYVEMANRLKQDCTRHPTYPVLR